MSASSHTSSSTTDQPLLAVACPTCFGAIAVGEDLFGQPADCPLCGSGFRVPRQTVSASPQRPVGTQTVEPQPRGTAESAADRRSVRESSRPDAQAPSATVVTEDLAGSAALAGTASDSAPESAPDSAPGGEYRFREPVRRVGIGDEAVELRRLSPEEKARRRSRRTLLIMLGGVSILLTIVLSLGRKRSKRREP